MTTTPQEASEHAADAPFDLDLALDAELRQIPSRSAGRLAYYVAGEGRPLLLIHSINAAGSAYEVRPVFEHYRTSRRVYALDLPGFGLSERSDRRYDIALYTEAISAMTRQIKDETGRRVDALALSLSSEFLARAATRAPDLFRSLALITPTGFRGSDAELRADPMSSREIGWLSRLLGRPRIGEFLFRLLSRPGVIRYFLKRTWGSPNIDEGLLAYDIETTRQPGARFAPLAFVSGALFSRDIRNVYEALELPVLLAHGTRGDFKDFRAASWTRAKRNWTRLALETGALPHFEQPELLYAAIDRFFDKID